MRGPSPGGGDRRRSRRLLRPLLAGAPRLGRRRPRRARRAHERLDVPLRRPRRPAPEHALAHEDDDGERRSLPLARGGGRARDGVARGRIAPARVVRRAHGGDLAPGRLGEDLRPSARADLGGRGAGALPADDDRRRARCGVPADGRLHRSEPADVRARGGRAASRRRDRDRHARHGRRRPARQGCRRRDRPRRDRDARSS